MGKDILKGIGAFIGVLLLVAAIGWFSMGNEFFMFKVFAPKMEQVRRKTFEESKAYRQGMVQELQNMQFEYIKADSVHKAALASVILHRAADFKEEDMPKDLYDFIEKLKKDQGLR